MKFLHVGLIIFLIAVVRAVRVDIHGERKPHSRFGRRATDLNNTADVSYYTDMKLGGKEFTLLVDTGSSDLWVAGRVPNSQSTIYTSSVHYAVGSVSGPVKTAHVEFAGYKIPDQAYLEITPDPDNPDGAGIMGLGPNYGSNIYQVVGSVGGAALLDRIFLQNVSTPNYLTVLLGRSQDPTDFYSGSLTIGEILDGYEGVVSEPKLPVIDLAEPRRGDQHFQVLLDEDGLIGPDGKAISLRTAVYATSNKKQLTAVVDTGFSLPQLPTAAAAAIYGRFFGSELVNIASIGPIWIVPCRQEVNITFRFGGKRYPIHPLDATIHPKTVGISTILNSQGQESCIGAFQPISYDTGDSPNYDMVLGMAFLRNVYTLMDYGDFIVDSTQKDDPYIQFLSTTDPAEAHTDFVKIRLDGIDSTPNDGLVNHHNPPSNKNHTVYYIAAAAAVGVVLLALGFFFLLRARRNRIRAATNHPVLPPAPYAPMPPTPATAYSGSPVSYGQPPPNYSNPPEQSFQPPQTPSPYNESFTPSPMSQTLHYYTQPPYNPHSYSMQSQPPSPYPYPRVA
ncbi:Pepsin A [Hypsizygus marmoreus]|uniref:Pepsin A n=1 Tax=Hypsizygus marmoreus TaxID=39966 RepID=A0A369IZM9_HYPMA|nr:Pepsin A [Hypsizygus marmoreus]